MATPLFAVLVVVETTDVMFAIDSIPAIFAILGLRSLYFLLAGMIPRFRYLKQGLAALLVFAGVKILIAEVWKMPVAVSLAVIVAILTISIVASLLATRGRAASDGRGHSPGEPPLSGEAAA